MLRGPRTTIELGRVSRSRDPPHDRPSPDQQWRGCPVSDRARRDHDELRIRGIVAQPLLGAMALADLHARRYDPEDPNALRHLPGKHDQSSHGRPGAKGLAKKAAKAVVKAVTAAGFEKAAKGRKALDAANAQIRRGKMSTRTAAKVRNIDKVMARSKLTEDVEVWRGVTSGRPWFGDRMDGDLAGFEWTEEAFVSTTADRLVAEQYAAMFDTPEPVLLMRVLAPEGTGAVAMTHMGAGGAMGDQAELLVDRNVGMRVATDHGVVEHPQIPQGVRLIDVIVKPKD